MDEEGLVPNARVIAKTVDSAFFTGPLRSPARIQNSFANESFIDELAAAAGSTPSPSGFATSATSGSARDRGGREGVGLELRNSPKPASKGDIATGRGMSAMQYEGEDGYAATVAEVEVNKRTGKVRVTRVVVAHDVGIIINPRGIKAQIEGTSSTVSPARSRRRSCSTARRRRAETGRLTRCSASPSSRGQDRARQPAERGPDRLGRERDDGDPGGDRNAIFDATGARIRRLPFTAARVKAALAEL